MGVCTARRRQAKSVNAVCGGGSVKSVNTVCGDGGGGTSVNTVQSVNTIQCAAAAAVLNVAVCGGALNLVTKPIGSSINMELHTIHYTQCAAARRRR
jgi:hypothetical protein